MKKLIQVTMIALLVLGSFAVAQQDPTPEPVSPGRVILWRNACMGQAATATFSIYRQSTDSSPLWQETQDLSGSYYSYAGQASGGLPTDIFSSGEGKWMSIVCNGDDSTRSLVSLTAVPYAISAVDSANLGGRPASDYALVGQAGSTSGKSSVTNEASRAQQAESELAQQVVAESDARKNANSVTQLNDMLNKSQIAAAIAAFQTQIAELRADNKKLSLQLAEVKSAVDLASNAALAQAIQPAVASTMIAKTAGAASATRSARLGQVIR